jgi:hypothetical protein
MKFLSIIRWLLVLPTACLSAVIGYYVVKLLYALARLLHDPEISFDWIEIVASFAGALGFSLGGGWAAPKRKNPTVMVLAGVVIVVSLAALLIHWGNLSWIYRLLLGSISVGGFAGLVVGAREDIFDDLDSYPLVPSRSTGSQLSNSSSVDLEKTDCPDNKANLYPDSLEDGVAVFRGAKGEDIRFVLVTTTLGQVKEYVRRAHPGSEFLRVEKR